ncbi:TIGR00366 family protein [Campylobacter sp. MIT 21-1685]|uniref:TIGR00366 family protein n=1 Tax=unclassified Campylobacter TaxID=2593542 RepID=UPI00224AD312|nr:MULTISPECIES: TIGR00366 family protein [unclassified Campylobacter]MCX2682280.1 TIGR00366 family protein [Campylobacter sp. MIT 21-1684]MCX2750560.1 TIGR00366 family protein [Campylobacter sp. MIT 21-1682]MCX2806892.1 TIGR00366 family protein [Campylobacter sp. MIT 21-1685]
MFWLHSLTRVCVFLASKCLPDSFVLVGILTLFVFLLTYFVTGQDALIIVNNWGNGAWSLLDFSMQMALVLVLGQALASAQLISSFLKYLSSLPNGHFSAIVLVTFLSLFANWINWGFGLVISAIFAKEIAKNVKGVDYRLLIASAYSGFVIWHGGLSGSIPLSVASASESLTKISAGVITEAIPISETIFSSYNLIITAIIVLFLPFLLACIHPKKEEIIGIDSKLLNLEEQDIELINHNKDKTLAHFLENSVLVSIIIAVPGLVYLIYYFSQGGSLNLNIVNMIFLFLGILLHKTPVAYVKAINHSAKSAAGILLQFPFYAGIMGMMTGTSDGGASFASMLSQAFASIATHDTFPILTFLSAGLVNIFVPSGGGQWAVQAPIMLPAGIKLGVSPSVVAMAIAWGDAWTNMIQPFWALPALAIAGLGAKDIMGYCVITLLFVGIVVSLGFLFLV